MAREGNSQPIHSHRKSRDAGISIHPSPHQTIVGSRCHPCVAVSCSVPHHLHILNRVEIHNRWVRGGQGAFIDCNKWRLEGGYRRKLSGRLPTVNLFDVFFFVRVFCWIKGAYRLISCSRVRVFSLFSYLSSTRFFSSLLFGVAVFTLWVATNESSTTSPWYPFAKKENKAPSPSLLHRAVGAVWQQIFIYFN